MLHKLSALVGYHIVATDGEIGHVDDFLVDEAGQTLQYLIVDTSNWIGGKSVMIGAGTLTNIDSLAQKIHVDLTRAAVEHAPRVEAADIDPSETLPAVWIM